MERKILKVGTRQSPLALAQTKIVCDKLMEKFDFLSIEIVPIKTTGDIIQDRTLAKVGGKGLFTKEIEEALLRREIHIAVHSMKDMPAAYPEGLIVPCVLEREDPRDVLIYSRKISLNDLPEGLTIGTASLRREAQILSRRPDLKVVPLRGNVQTRLRKIKENHAEATILALAGLKRLGIESVASHIFSTEEMVPAVGQGAIGVECRSDDLETYELLSAINHRLTFICLEAERAFLRTLDGSCQTPIGGYAEIKGDSLILHGYVSQPKGINSYQAAEIGEIPSPAELGITLAHKILKRVGPDFFKKN